MIDLATIPRHPALAVLTDAQLDRLADNVWARMNAAFCDGGSQPFGVDAPTLRAAMPGWYAAILTVAAECKRRQS